MPERRLARRNLAAASPLLRKGGVHQRSRTGRRQLERRSLDAALDEWWDGQGADRRFPGRPPPQAG